jgi:hypothetical protein
MRRGLRCRAGLSGRTWVHLPSVETTSPATLAALYDSGKNGVAK